MKNLICDERSDPIDRLVRDLTADEMTDWLIQCHGLPPDRRSIVSRNLNEQYKWHRLQGRLDRSTVAGLIAELWLMRRSAKILDAAREQQPDG